MFDKLQNFINSFKDTPYWVFAVALVCLIGGEFIYSPGFNTYFWTPPKDSLVSANGFFIPTPPSECAPTYCIPAPLRFQTTSGQILAINCEPTPPINKCIQAYAPAYLGLPEKPARIQYATWKEWLSGTPYRVLMSISDGPHVVIDYNHRLNEIRRTVSYHRRKIGIPRRRLSDRSDELFFLIRELVTWGLFILALKAKITAPKTMVVTHP